jgi:hypothetical protein
MTIFKGRINEHIIFFIVQAVQHLLGNTESPIFFVVRSSVWDQVWLIRQREKVFLQLRKFYFSINWHAVIQDVQIRFLKINNLFPFCILYIRIPNIPLSWHNPVKNLCASRHFMQFNWNMFF